MKAAGFHQSRRWAATLAVALAAQFPLAHAAIVDTDSLAAPSQAELDRAKVQAFLDRASVQDRLQAMGLSGVVAKDRVASLSPTEVHALAERIDAMPAGGAIFTTQQWILIVLGAILLAIVL